MGEEIFTFLRESKYSVSLITVPFCPVAPCPFQILAGVLKKISENGRRMDDGPWLYYKLTNKPKGSGELIKARFHLKADQWAILLLGLFHNLPIIALLPPSSSRNLPETETKLSKHACV